MINFIKIVVLTLFVSFPSAYGMEVPSENASTENQPTLQAGDFTGVPDEVVLVILSYICKHLPEASLLDAFESWEELAGFEENKESLGRFGITCKKLNHLSKPYIIANRTILNNLLLNTLDFDTIRRNSKEIKYEGQKTYMRVSSCLDAGADVNCLDHFNRTPIILAIENCPHSDKTIEILINKKGVNLDHDSRPNDSYFEKKTPLHYALENRPYIAGLLINAGADLLKANADGSLLSCAVKQASDCALELLIKHGVDVRQKDKYGETPLYNSIQKVDGNYNHLVSRDLLKARLEIAQKLIQEGADVNQANDDGKTALYKAVLHGRIDIIKLLITHGADVNQVFKNGETPLYVAAYHCYYGDSSEDIMKLLIKHGAHVDRAIYLINNLPKHEYLKEKAINKLKAVNNEVQQSRRIKMGQIEDCESDTTTVSNSFDQLPDEIIKQIIEYLYPLITDQSTIGQINKYTRIFDSDFKILHDELDYLSNSKKACNQLYATCKKFNHLDKSFLIVNKTILNNLLFKLIDKSEMEFKYSPLITSCICAGADIDCTNEWNKTPLDCAIGECCYGAMESLLECGADAKKEGALVKVIDQCYHKALSHNPYDITELFIKHGAQANQVRKDRDGNTPLHASIIKETYTIWNCDGMREIPLEADSWLRSPFAKEQSLRTARYLIQHGAHIDQANDWHETPLFKAVLNNQLEMVELLISHGADVNQIRYGVPLLCKAAEYGASDKRKKIITVFIENGADVDAAIGKLSRRTRSKIDIDLLSNINAQVKRSKENDSNRIIISESDATTSSVSDVESSSGSDSDINELYSADKPDSSDLSNDNNYNKTPVKESAINNVIIPNDDYDSDDSSSSSSESESIDLLHQLPHVPGFESGDKKDFTTIFASLCANKLLTISGAVIVGGICYWAYKKYQAYRATQKEEDEEKEGEAVVADQLVEQLSVAT